jgi:hypothetical protein
LKPTLHRSSHQITPTAEEDISCDERCFDRLEFGTGKLFSSCTSTAEQTVALELFCPLTGSQRRTMWLM